MSGHTDLSLVQKPCTKVWCPIVGQPHERCKAHNVAKRPCMHYPRKGQLVCTTHGGNTAASLSTASRRLALQEVRTRASLLVNYDETDPETPEQGLLREILWSGQVARAYGAAAEALQDEQLTNRSVSGERLNIIVEYWTRERELHAKLCKMAIDAHIEQRQLDIIETQAGQIVALMLALLSAPELNLTSNQIIEGRVVAARVLRQRAITEGTPNLK